MTEGRGSGEREGGRSYVSHKKLGGTCDYSRINLSVRNYVIEGEGSTVFYVLFGEVMC